MHCSRACVENATHVHKFHVRFTQLTSPLSVVCLVLLFFRNLLATKVKRVAAHHHIITIFVIAVDTECEATNMPYEKVGTRILYVAYNYIPCV